ncbi:MAG: LysR family transcriptional regulator [Pseudomonadota bacterium]
MDRLEAMQAFIAALDDGSLAAAGRRLGKSAAAMTRAIAALEADVGGRLFERTTRLVRLTEIGTRYAATARRILAEYEEIRTLGAGASSAPRGVLRITAPITAGVLLVRPVVDAFLAAHPDVSIRLLLFDRPANLVEEGLDVALRIAHLPDSDLVAMPVGAVRRVVCASPGYLAATPMPMRPGDLTGHRTITLAESRQAEHWVFPAHPGRAGGRTVRLTPRLSVNNVDAARASAIDGAGITRLFSYQIADDVRAGRLRILLAPFEPAPLPVHLVMPRERLAIARTRAFVDFAIPRLRSAFTAAALESP